MGYPRQKKKPAVQIDIRKIASELTCRYCGRGFSSLAQLRGHLGQCVKRGAFLKKLEQGVIVIVHQKYFHIMPKSISSLQHVEEFLDIYKERNGQPELWEKDINTFLGALTALHMEKKLNFEMLSKEEAIKLAHSVAQVYTDGSLQEDMPTAPIDVTPQPSVEPEAEVKLDKVAKPLVEVLKDKKKRAKDQQGNT